MIPLGIACRLATVITFSTCAFSTISRAQETTVAVNGRDAFIDTVNALRLGALHALIDKRSEDLVHLARTYCVDTAFRRRDTLPILTFEEQALVFFRSGNYSSLLNGIDAGTHYYHQPDQVRGERPSTASRTSSVSLTYGLRDLWRSDAQHRLDHISKTITSTSERQLLSAYWMRSLNDLLAFPQDLVFTNEAVNAEANAFLAASADSVRGSFTSRFLVRRRPRKTPSWGIGMSAGGIYPTGATEKLISGGGLWQLSAEFEFHGLYAGVDFSMSRSKVERPFSLDSITTTVGEHVTFGGAGAHIGFKVLDIGRVRLIPTVSLAENRFSYDPEDGRQETRNEVSFVARAELIADIRLNSPRADIRLLGNRGWWNGIPASHPYFRMRIGWQPEAAGSMVLARSGFYYFSVGFGAFVVSQRRPR